MKFHVNALGKPSPCRATKRSCPFGGDETHYATMEEAFMAAFHEELREQDFEFAGTERHSSFEQVMGPHPTPAAARFKPVEAPPVLGADESPVDVMLGHFGIDNEGEAQPDSYLTDETLQEVSDAMEDEFRLAEHDAFAHEPELSPVPEDAAEVFPVPADETERLLRMSEGERAAAFSHLSEQRESLFNFRIK